MDIDPYYRLPNQALWIGRVDNNDISNKNNRIFQKIKLTNYQSGLVGISDNVVIAGFACDEGIRRNQGRLGAREGPSALRHALANYPLHHQANHLQLLDIGDIDCFDGNLEKSQLALGTLVEKIINTNNFPLIFGGGHETAWGHYLGLAKKYNKSNLAIVNFDAHFDMRPLLPGNQGSSGTPFLQIAQERKKNGSAFHYYVIGIQESSNTESLFNTAKRCQVEYLLVDKIYESVQAMTHFLDNIIAKHDHLYISVCLDVFAGSSAKGVSASSPNGLQPWQVILGLKHLAASNKVIALDVVELSPPLDEHNLTAKLAGLCVAEFLYHFSLNQAAI